jgi:D-arabinose 5-phosphate isomerase GutQ
MNDDALRRAQESFRIESAAILLAGETMNYAAFSLAVDSLLAANRIATSGCGHSGIACMHFAHSMCCIERPARFLSPSEALHGGLGYLCSDDVMVLASRGGGTAELLPIMDICRKKRCTVIAVTENLESRLAIGADIVLPMKVERETDRNNCQGTASFIATCAVFDALQTAMAEEMEFTSEQFALIHPGGAVGARLNR